MAMELLDFYSFVRTVLDAVEAVGIEYMIGGGVAIAAWGEGRSTQDLDLIVYLEEKDLEPLSKEFWDRGMAVPPDIMHNLIADTRSDLAINAIHGYSGFKAELFPLRRGDTLRQSALKRRREVELPPPLGKVYVHSPEDLILYKLLYYSISHQTKHVRDIKSILARIDNLDIPYIEHWATQRNLMKYWEEISERA